MDRGGELSVESPTTDAELLAGLRQRGAGPLWQALMAAFWSVGGVFHLLGGTWWLGVAYLVLALLMTLAWWRDPRPRLRAVTDEAVLVRRGSRVQTITQADLLDVRPRYTGPYGLELSVRDAEPLRLDGTAQRFSVAEAQAGALRRWAGLGR